MKANPGNVWFMNQVIKSLWASVQGDPVFMRRVNGWLTIFWIAMIPLSIVTHWISSVAYVAALSLWALVSGHWSAWQAARVEVKQAEDEEKRRREDIAGDVVQRILAETDLKAATTPRAGRSDHPHTPVHLKEPSPNGEDAFEPVADLH